MATLWCLFPSPGLRFRLLAPSAGLPQPLPDVVVYSRTGQSLSLTLSSSGLPTVEPPFAPWWGCLSLTRALLLSYFFIRHPTTVSPLVISFLLRSRFLSPGQALSLPNEVIKSTYSIPPFLLAKVLLHFASTSTHVFCCFQYHLPLVHPTSTETTLSTNGYGRWHVVGGTGDGETAPLDHPNRSPISTHVPQGPRRRAVRCRGAGERPQSSRPRREP